MKSILCVVVLVSIISADKEFPEEGSNALLSPKLWKVIEKRLKDYGYDEIQELGDELDDPHCANHEVSNNTIIRTHDSQNAGATYIDSPEITSRDACLRECCSIENCNIAVYKEMDQDQACYLFDCGTPNICLFTTHPGYSVLKLTSRTTTDKVQEKHENDLQKLAVESTTTTTTTTVPTTPEMIIDPVPLFSECNAPEDCAVKGSSCLEGYCLCNDGYHEQEGICRKDCSKFEFECHNLGQPMMYPQCVGIYNKCDGIPLCIDKSDESDCDSGYRGFYPLRSKWNQAKGYHADTGFGWIGNKGTMDKPHSAGKMDDSSSSPPRQQVPKKSPERQNKPGVQAQPKVVMSGEPVAVADTVADQDPGSSQPEVQYPASDTSDNSDTSEIDPDAAYVPDTPVGDQDSSNQPVAPASSSQVEQAEEPSSAVGEASSGKEKGSAMALNSELVDVQNTGIIVTKENTEEKVLDTMNRFYQSNRGAVVALSLGLAVTALLLIFVGCRLRNVKKRLRKGRPLNSNEADYLINGMYL